MRRLVFFLGSLLCHTLLVAQIPYQQRVIKPEPRPWGPYLWPHETPETPPVSQSSDLAAAEFMGRSVSYTAADTWYPSWASNDTLYSPFTDGTWGIWKLVFSATGPKAMTGQAKIVGNDPLNLEVIPLGATTGSAAPYGGRYPCGSLVHNGVWYYGTYCLDGYPSGYNWGTLGPFVGFRISKDYGLTWEDTPHTPLSPLFGETAKDSGCVKIGAPHFVDFGKNMEHSPDGKAYLVAHGSVAEDPQPRPANNSWISGDQIYLLRVTLTIENINDRSKYEYFAGYNRKGKAVWSKDFKKIKPVFEWNNHCGCVTMTYFPHLKKYIMCITDGWPTIKYMNTYFLESDHVEGPWKMVTYMKNFGEQAYFVNIPSKFIDKDKNSFWLCYSGNFAAFQELKINPPGGRYAMVLQEMRFLDKKQLAAYPLAENKKKLDIEKAEWDKRNPLTSKENLALQAKVSVSSLAEGYSEKGVNDGIVDGFPGHPENEWASNQTVNSWVRLTWDKKVTVGKIWLFDRPYQYEQILSCGLKMSDGTIIELGALSNVEGEGLEIAFEPKEVEWIEFVVLGVGNSQNSGLSEFTVFNK